MTGITALASYLTSKDNLHHVKGIARKYQNTKYKKSIYLTKLN